MNELLTQLGMGGILAILVIREVLGFLKNSRNRQGNFVTRNEYEKHKSTVRYVDTCEKMHEALNHEVKDLKQFVKESIKEIKNLIRKTDEN